MVDTGQGTQTFEIVARRAGRRIEITNVRGVVEVSEVTRSGTPIRTGRFMANRLIALVEHPAVEGSASAEVEARPRRASADQTGRTGRSRRADLAPDGPRQLTVLGDDDGSDDGSDGAG